MLLKSKFEIRKSKIASRSKRPLEFAISNVEFPYAVSRWSARFAAGLALLVPSGIGYAQGCAMCYNTTAAAKAAAIQALRSGILVLLIPPLLMFIAIFVMAYWKRERFNDQSALETDYDQELKNWLSSMPAEELSPKQLSLGSGLGATSVLPAEDTEASSTEHPKANSWK